MTLHIQQQSTDSFSQHLFAKLQQLTDSLHGASNIPFPEDLFNLIAQAKDSLTCLQVDLLYKQAIAQGTWDFFPTPQPLVEKMLSLAQIQPGMKVLEPQAGLGHICQEIRKLGVEPDCFEVAPILYQSLILQGFNIIGKDFLTSRPTAIYDRILANPPFSRNGIARHTLVALDWLRPGGRLVTVAHHYQLKPSPTDRAFFHWLKGFDAQFCNCGQAFQDGDRPCNIPIQLIVINKPCW